MAQHLPRKYFFRFGLKFGAVCQKICTHGERYRNLMASIFEIQTFFWQRRVSICHRSYHEYVFSLLSLAQCRALSIFLGGFLFRLLFVLCRFCTWYGFSMTSFLFFLVVTKKNQLSSPPRVFFPCHRSVFIRGRGTYVSASSSRTTVDCFQLQAVVRLLLSLFFSGRLFHFLLPHYLLPQFCFF